MKTYKQLVENFSIGRLEETLENPDTLKKIADAIKSKYGFEVSASKSTLGGGEPSYFLKVFGPKDTWTNGIAMNSPFHVMFRIDNGTIEMPTNSYQVRNAKAKMRKTKYKNDADLEKKLMDYFSKNKSAIDGILKEELNESNASTISKMRDMVNKKTQSRLLMIGGTLVNVTLKDASNLITLYDNQSNSAKKELEKEISSKKGLENVIKDMSENVDLEEANKYSNYKVMIDGKHIMTVDAKSEDEAHLIVDRQLQHSRKYIDKATPAVKELKIKKWMGRLPEYEDIKLVKESNNNENLEEASEYEVSHKTFSSAVQHAWNVAEKRGYEVDEDDWDEKVSLGPKKPSKGKTNSYSIDLMKKGKPVKQKLHMQVYYDEGRYELNMYIQ